MNRHGSGVAALTAGYGLVVAVANARHDPFTNDFTPRGEWLLFDGGSGFPDDFGRNVFAGTVGLGLVFVAFAGLVALCAGTRRALPLGAAAMAVSLLLVALYRDDGNLLGARPSAAAVLLAVGLYLVGSSLSATDGPEPVGEGPTPREGTVPEGA